MSKDFTVVRHGVDSSGHTIYMTRYMEDWWEALCEALGFVPTIVQGSFMTRNGGGARASAGYHDQAGCLDIRVWDRTEEEVAKIIRTARRMAGAAWLRNAQHGGMDPHIHLVLGPDSPLAGGAGYQWSQYLNGRDGLASNGGDYHWRPSPLVTDWDVPAPKPTPNITTALRTKDRGQRRIALRKIVKHADSKAAVRAAKSYLRAMELQDKARAKTAAARAVLKKEEVRQ